MRSWQLRSGDKLCIRILIYYFNTVVSKLLDTNITPKQIQEVPDIPVNTESIFLKPTIESEVIRTIQNLKNKSRGGDQIHAFTSKFAAPYISSILADIINNTFTQGIRPKQSKTADFCPVYKSGSKKHVNNYRPIYSTYFKFGQNFRKNNL